MEALYGLLLPFLGTSLGAASVFFMKKAMSDGLQKGLTGFAAGVMTAASVWSLLIPAIERSEELGKWSFAPAAAGLWLGFLFLLALDHIIPHRGDRRLFWDRNNWQALCKSCHDSKTMTEDRYEEFRYPEGRSKSL